MLLWSMYSALNATGTSIESLSSQGGPGGDGEGGGRDRDGERERDRDPRTASEFRSRLLDTSSDPSDSFASYMGRTIRAAALGAGSGTL